MTTQQSTLLGEKLERGKADNDKDNDNNDKAFVVQMMRKIE